MQGCLKQLAKRVQVRAGVNQHFWTCFPVLALTLDASLQDCATFGGADIDIDRSASVRIVGKGRKLRQVPLWKNTARLVRYWLKRVQKSGADPVFPNRRGQPLTRSGVEKRLRAIVERASPKCPSLIGRRISPHTLRHTTAMHMLQAGVDVTSLALWLGHESPTTTHGYVQSDLAMKEKALRKLEPPSQRTRRFRVNDSLLAFLDKLGR